MEVKYSGYSWIHRNSYMITITSLPPAMWLFLVSDPGKILLKSKPAVCPSFLFLPFHCEGYLFSTSQMLDSEQDQNWSLMHMEQPYTNIAGTGPVENSSLFYPVESMSIDGVHYAPSRAPAQTLNGYISSSHGAEVSRYQPDLSGPSHDPFLHTSTGETFFTVPENYAHYASSTHYDRQSFRGVEGRLVDLTVDSGRGLNKRKSPGIPSSCEGGSTSRYYDAGSSSDLSLSLEMPHEKPNFDPQSMPWEHLSMFPSYQGNLSPRAEEPTRNVRSRPVLDLESNLGGTQFSRNSSHVYYPASHIINHSNPVDFPGPSSGALTTGWNHARMSPAHEIIVSDPPSFSHERNCFLVGSSMNNTSVDIRGYQHDFNLRRSSAVSHPVSTHSERGRRSSHILRNSPTFRASSSHLQFLGHEVQSDEGMQSVADNYSSREPRPLLSAVWRSNDRNGRSRISHDRYRSLPNEACLQDRISPEGYMAVEHSAFYGSRNLFDHHRDMRLDIDNMSYEELLALGERIGNVNTGLSEDLMHKCLTETIYYSLEHNQEEGICVICLEEYKDMDDVGALKICGHGYHANCIKKWLSMKNLCPICKASVLEET